MTEPWIEEFDKEFGVFKWSGAREVFPCEGGNCDTNVKDIKAFITRKQQELVKEMITDLKVMTDIGDDVIEILIDKYAK